MVKGWQITTTPEEVDGDCFPCQLDVVGQDSASFRRRKAELFRMAQSNKKRKFNEAESEGVKTVASGITGWSHIVWNNNPKDPSSKPYLIEFSNDNVVTVLSGYQPGRDQVDAFIADRSNFFTSA